MDYVEQGKIWDLESQTEILSDAEELREEYEKTLKSLGEANRKYYDLIYAIDASIHKKERSDHKHYLYLDYGVREDGSIGVLDTETNRLSIEQKKDSCIQNKCIE